MLAKVTSLGYLVLYPVHDRLGDGESHCSLCWIYLSRLTALLLLWSRLSTLSPLYRRCNLAFRDLVWDYVICNEDEVVGISCIHILLLGSQLVYI